MQTTKLGVSPLTGSRLAYGCWRLAVTSKAGEMTPESAAAGRRAVNRCREAGRQKKECSRLR
jgi:aryl-alcohol dehydrogenase-like predicted oxidoreductase